MNDDRRAYDYPPEVKFQIRDDVLEDYVRAADFLNAQKYDVVSLQHEFGIFGGDAGAHILTLLAAAGHAGGDDLPHGSVPSHACSAQCPAQDRGTVVRRGGDGGEGARTAAHGLWRSRSRRSRVIPHGIPDFPFVEPDLAKVKLGFTDKPVILTFGLLSPNKGIEVVIDAMPLILKSRPDAVYVVLGATHPNLVRQEGEAYRESLMARARELGVHDNVVFLDQFVDQPTLLDFISMCDVYVTPYLNEAQMTSGTLAYSFGLGKAVVSTPYWHARELLADGRGVLVPFHDSAAIGTEISGLLTDECPAPGHACAGLFRKPVHDVETHWGAVQWRFRAGPPQPSPECDRKSGQKSAGKAQRMPPDMQIGHLLSMCDDTGLFQHAIHSIPDRSHGYCIDDNARALLLACALNTAGEEPLSEVLDGAAGGLPSARLESGNTAVSELHELRPCLARRKRLGR